MTMIENGLQVTFVFHRLIRLPYFETFILFHFTLSPAMWSIQPSLSLHERINIIPGIVILSVFINVLSNYGYNSFIVFVHKVYIYCYKPFLVNSFFPCNFNIVYSYFHSENLSSSLVSEFYCHMQQQFMYIMHRINHADIALSRNIIVSSL